MSSSPDAFSTQRSTTNHPLTTDPTAELLCREACRVATDMYRARPDWVTFFREILGVNGVVRRLFTDADLLAEFEKSEDYRRIQQMLARLRQQATEVERREPTKVITVRLPQSLHELLRVEAHERQTSINRLCISKLLQVLDG